MLDSRSSDTGQTTRSDAPTGKSPHVWAIASGKGGVGKSVVSTNFAVSLAGRGHSCALLDLDLGCANLHTMLGVASGRGGVGRLIDKEAETLAEALVPTGIEGLSLLSGNQAGPGTANLAYAQKQRIIRQVRRLEVDHVVMDLGAGTAFNVLDFFLEADSGVVVVVPEPTSIENTYSFLLAAFLRSLRAVMRTREVRTALDKAIARHRGKLPEPRDLLAAVVAEDAQAGVALWERFESFSANLIVNRVRHARHHELGPQIARDARKHFGASLNYAGAIVADDCVVSAVVARRAVIHQFPGSSFARDLDSVVDSMLSADEAPAQPMRIHESEPEAVPAAPKAAKTSVDLSRPGASLRLRREELELTLTECEHRTRIRCLEEIEQEQFDKLPPEQYLRAFVAQYALLLGIDEAAALATSFIDHYQDASQEPQGRQFAKPAADSEPDNGAKSDASARARARPPQGEASHRRRRRARSQLDRLRRRPV